MVCGPRGIWKQRQIGSLVWRSPSGYNFMLYLLLTKPNILKVDVSLWFSSPWKKHLINGPLGDAKPNYSNEVAIKIPTSIFPRNTSCLSPGHCILPDVLVTWLNIFFQSPYSSKHWSLWRTMGRNSHQTCTFHCGLTTKLNYIAQTPLQLKP